ncbi:MAG: OmpA family protein [Nitrospinota bacterium]|nr:OmpA family protein [Nitrospinota bacterium]
MENQQTLALMKEKLREKDREMRSRDAKQAKNEERFKQVLSLTEKKISALKQTVSSQEGKIQQAEKVAEEKESAAPSTEKEGDSATATEEGSVQDPKLQEELEELRKKNKELGEKSDAEEKDRKKLETEKALLVKEFKKLKSSNQDQVQSHHKDLEKVEKLSGESHKEKEKLAQEKEAALSIGKKLSKEKKELLDKIKKIKDDPASVKNLQKKMAEQEKKIQESIKKSEDFAKEKEELIKSYEDMLYIEEDGKEGKEGKERRLPSEIIEELKKELGAVKEEKKLFEEKLQKEKQKFDEKLKEEKTKIMDELENPKANKNTKIKGGAADEVMAEEGAPGWMITFADMVTLLMVFFVLFFSISKENMSIMEAAIVGEGKAGIGLLELMNSLEVRQNIKVQSQDVPKMVEVESDSSDRSKIVFRVPGSSLFKSGDAYLKKEARKVLEKIAAITLQYPKYKINIQGHTDDVPIFSERFPTNWELSASRATAVLRFFIDKGIEPERLTATGYADVFPLVSNETELGRSKNRRVEFVLEKEKRF